MKKTMFIAILMFLSVFVIAEESSWLQVEWAFQLGWIPQGAISFYKPSDIVPFQPFDICFNIDAIIFDFINIGGKATSVFQTTRYKFDFFPTGITYDFHFGIMPFKGLSIFYEHSCSHPIAVYAQKNDGTPILDAGYDRIYFEIKGKINY